jgi:type II secretory pathway pseudopilin PulG
MPVVSPLRKTVRRRQEGYILITLMLLISLVAIGLAVMLPQLAFQVRRDREEEMIHRGVQYSRAIKRYYKKFGRYPTRIEELENTNNVRFLRRRYKDPITGKDFKLLHFGQVPMGMGGAGMAGAMAAAGAAGGLGGRGGVNTAMMGTLQAQAGMAAMAGGLAAMQSNSGAGTANSPFGQSSLNSSDQSGTDNGNGDTKGTNAQQKQGASGSDKLAGQVFGGGPIIGVASASKAETIRQFASKNHYNEWNFVYDPSLDRGGLITGPAQPLQGLGGLNGQQGLNGATAGTQGQNGFGQSGFGQGGLGQSGFGQGGFGQSGTTQPQPQPQPPAQTPQDQQ